MSNQVKTIVIIIVVVFLLGSIGVLGLIAQLVPVSRVQTFETTAVETKNAEANSFELTKSIVDQIFPGSKYTIENGRINFTSQVDVYKTLYLEQLSFGKFIDSSDEYLAILRAPDDVTVHAGGFYFSIGAVFDSKTNKIKSPVQRFVNDEGEISILKGKDHDYIFYLGSTMYQGWAEAQGMLYDLGSGQWEKAWPLQSDFWKDKSGVFGNNRLVLYKRVIEPHNQEAAIPPNHFELDSELIWDQNAETFREPATWE